MFIAWGSSTKVAHVDHIEAHHCDTCAGDKPFNVFLRYRVHHVWYLFRWITQKAYVAECAGCGRVIEAAGEEYERNQASNPVDFIDRFGWAIGLAGIAAIGLLGFLADRQNRQQDQALIAAPHVNDLYEVDMARMSDHPEAPIMYSLLRVKAVTPQGVEVQAANLYYNQMRGVTRDIEMGRARQDNYYGAETGLIPIDGIRRMQAEGVLIDVIR
jgi:hypothetical protein